MSIAPKAAEPEVERAVKSQLKASLLLGLDWHDAQADRECDLQQPLSSIIINCLPLSLHTTRLTTHSSSRGHPSYSFTSFRPTSFWPWPSRVYIPPYLPSISPCNPRYGPSSSDLGEGGWTLSRNSSPCMGHHSPLPLSLAWETRPW